MARVPTWIDQKIWVPSHKHFPFQAAGMGLSSIDRVLTIPTYPPPGGKVPVMKENIHPGGQIATAMVAARVLGLSQVLYLGKIGNDTNGERQRESLTAAGVTSKLLVGSGSSPSAIITVAQDSGERTVFWNYDPAMTITPEEIPRDFAISAPIILLDGCDTQAAHIIAQEAVCHDICTVLDVDTFYPELSVLIPFITCCLASHSLLESDAGPRDLLECIQWLHHRGPSLVLFTLGINGAIASFRNCEPVHFPAFSVHCLDTTGAGDVFHGAFLYGLHNHLPMSTLIPFCHGASALACQSPGARGGLVDASVVDAFIQTQASPSPHRWGTAPCCHPV